MNDAEAEQRVSSRRWAEESYEASEDKPAFVQRVMQLGGMEPKPGESAPPMTDHEALSFSREIMFFGVYKDFRIDDIPLSYLCNLTDPSDCVTVPTIHNQE